MARWEEKLHPRVPEHHHGGGEFVSTKELNNLLRDAFAPHASGPASGGNHKAEDELRAQFDTHSGNIAWRGQFDSVVTSAIDNPDYGPQNQAVSRLVKQIGEPAARRIAWESDAEAALGRHILSNRPADPNADPYADLVRITPTEMAKGKVDAARELKQRFAGKKVAIQIRPDSLAQFLRDGRMKGALETGRSGGEGGGGRDYRNVRAQSEQVMFGLGSDSPHAGRPIYGYLVDERSTSGDARTTLATYGDVQVVLKDSVRPRTTASVGDSIDDKILPSPVDNPEWYSTNHMFGRYDEAQVHGGVKPSDVQEVVFQTPPQDSLARQLDKAGVPWRLASDPPAGGAASTARSDVHDALAAHDATTLRRIGRDSNMPVPSTVKTKAGMVKYLTTTAAEHDKRNHGGTGATPSQNNLRKLALAETQAKPAKAPAKRAASKIAPPRAEPIANEVTFDPAKATNYSASAEVKHARLVRKATGEKTTITPEWGGEQSFVGSYYEVIDPKTGQARYGSALREWRDMHGRVAGSKTGWRKTSTVDAYQHQGSTGTLVTRLKNGTVETQNTVNPGDWIVRQKHGETQVLSDAEMRKLYQVPESPKVEPPAGGASNRIERALDAASRWSGNPHIHLGHMEALTSQDWQSMSPEDKTTVREALGRLQGPRRSTPGDEIHTRAGALAARLAEKPPARQDWVAKVSEQIAKPPAVSAPRPYTGPEFQVPEGVPQEAIDRARQAFRHFNTNLEAHKALEPLGGHAALKHRVVQEGQVQHALDTWRKDHPEVTGTYAEVRKDLQRQTQEAFAGKKIAVRITPAGLAKVLADGRFKTQFETNRSSGLKKPYARAEAEAAWFGIGQDLTGDAQIAHEPDKRPIYGYVALDGVRPAGVGSSKMFDVSTDALSQYGRVQVILKDRVRERTTAMFGDSLNNRPHGMPSPVDSPSWMSFSPAWKSYMARGLAGQTRDPMSQEFRSAQYAEAQIHGGVNASDIEEVVFPSTPPAALRVKLETSRIPWRVHNFQTAAKADSASERAVALQIAEQDHQYLTTEIADAQAKLADAQSRNDSYTVKQYTDDIKQMRVQLKAITAALPALRAAGKGVA